MTDNKQPAPEIKTRQPVELEEDRLTMSGAGGDGSGASADIAITKEHDVSPMLTYEIHRDPKGPVTKIP